MLNKMVKKAGRESGAGHVTEPIKRFLKAGYFNICLLEVETGTVL